MQIQGTLVRNGDPARLPLLLHHPALEALEPRLLLTNYVVNSLADVVMSDGVVTLREAIGAANANMAITTDVRAGSATQVDNITFHQAALQIQAGPGNPLVITLNGTQLRISGDLNVQGLGEDVLTIDADGRSTVIYVAGQQTDVDLAGLTITGGSVMGHGGGIHNSYGTVRLTNSTVSGNAAEVQGSFGGGIYNGFGTVTLTGSTVSDNWAYWDGGGIYNRSGTVRLTDSTVSGNAAWDGAGIVNYIGGTLTLVNSTVSDNWIDGAGGSGGGIYNGESTVTLTNSTVTGNWADAAGGGIENWLGTVTMTNSMVAGNAASEGGGIYNHIGTVTLRNSTAAGNAAYEGGGIYNHNGTLTLNNTIVAVNDATASADVYGSFTNNSSLVGGVPGFVRNPSGGDYGDLRLRPTSPGIDAGNNALLPADAFDLDGDHNVAEPVPLDLAGGPRVAGGVVDIGAYELQASDVPGTPNLADGSDTGIPDDDKTNRDNDAGRTLDFEVTGTVAGATVRIYADGTEIGSATAAGTTTTVTTNGSHDLIDGSHLITATQQETDKPVSAPTAPLVITVDTVPPTADITDINPDPRNSAVNEIEVVFSEAVGGFGIDDLALTLDGGANLLTGESLTTADNTTWTLGNLTGLTGAGGTYTLTLTAAGSAVQDAVGNPLAGDAADTWQTDADAPTADITDVNPDPRNSAVNEIEIAFSEAVTGFGIDDLALTLDGGANLLTGESLTTSDNTTWTLGGLTGLTGAGGTYTLTLTAAGSGVQDAVGNPLAGDASDTWQTDAEAPTADITDVNPDPRNSAVNEIEIAFSEAVSGFGIDDLALTLDGGANLLTGEPLTTSDNTTWTLGGLAGLTGAGGTYTLLLTAPGSGIQDAVGNPLAGDAADTWETDADAPTVDITDVNPDPRNSAVGEIEVVFSEAVSGFGIDDLALTLDGGANLLTGESLTTADNITWTLGGLTGLTGAGGTYTLLLTAPGSGIQDAVGNPLAGDAADTWETDAEAPTADITDVNPDPRNSAVNEIEVVFSEAVGGFGIDDLALTLDGGANLLTGESLTTADNITWTLGGLAGLTGAGGTYTLLLTATGSGIQDAVGNSLAGDASDNWVKISLSSTPNRPELADDSDTGIPDDNITKLDNDAGRTLDFEVSGTVAGATVRIYADGTEIGSATGAETTTTVTTNGSHDLIDGTHLITATQQETGNLESADSEALTVTIDTEAPTLDTWSSAAAHVGYGELLLEIPDDGNFTEPRRYGIEMLVLEFSEDVDLSGASVAIAGNNDDSGPPMDLTAIDVALASRNPDPVFSDTGEIAFTTPAPDVGLPDVARYLVQLDGVVADRAGNTLADNGDRNRIMTSLIGNMKGDNLVVDVRDLYWAWFYKNQHAGDGLDHRRADMDLNGVIDVRDLYRAWSKKNNRADLVDPVLPSWAAAAAATPPQPVAPQGAADAFDAAAALFAGPASSSAATAGIPGIVPLVKGGRRPSPAQGRERGQAPPLRCGASPLSYMADLEAALEPDLADILGEQLGPVLPGR